MARSLGGSESGSQVDHHDGMFDGMQDVFVVEAVASGRPVDVHTRLM
jgi:hypothetical protein